MAIDANKVISGTYGTLYVNIDGVDTELANVKKFEAKLTAKYEDIETTNELGKSRKFVGYEIKGSYTVAKLNFETVRTVANSFKTGTPPQVRLVGAIDDPSADDHARVVLTGVTFDEIDLMSFETKKALEEEYGFEATNFDYT